VTVIVLDIIVVTVIVLVSIVVTVVLVIIVVTVVVLVIIVVTVVVLVIVVVTAVVLVVIVVTVVVVIVLCSTVYNILVEKPPKIRNHLQDLSLNEIQGIHARLGRATHKRNTAWTPQYGSSVSEVWAYILKQQRRAVIISNTRILTYELMQCGDFDQFAVA
jgi:hypothetical protein